MRCLSAVGFFFVIATLQDKVLEKEIGEGWPTYSIVLYITTKH